CRHRSADRAPHAHRSLLIDTDSLFERVALDVLDLSDMERSKWHEPARGSGLSHREVDLPILVTDCRRCRAREVIEIIARRVLRSTFEVLALIHTVKRRSDNTGVLAGLDLFLESFTFWSAGDVNECRYPIECGEQLVLDGPRLDVSWPSDHARSAVAALPCLSFLPLEWSDAAVREGDRFSAVVGGEDNDGVIQLAHLLQLRQHHSDVVIHLLHAGFVDAPVLASLCAHHGFVFW